AIWTALHRRGITYSNIASTTPQQNVLAQHVRFVDGSIVSTQANCVDGSVLFASVLRKIGIQSYLVLVPGHCYVAYQADPNDPTSIIGVETTMLASKSRTAFADAIGQASSHGEVSLARNAEKFSDPNSGYMLVDLDAARNLGIMPLPYMK